MTEKPKPDDEQEPAPKPEEPGEKEATEAP